MLEPDYEAEDLATSGKKMKGALVEDQTTQCSVQQPAIMNTNRPDSQSCEDLSRLAYQDYVTTTEGKHSVGEISTIIHNRQLDSMHKQLKGERSKRKEMERTLANLVQLSGALNNSVNVQRQKKKAGKGTVAFMDGLGAKRNLIRQQFEAANHLKRP